MHDPQLDQMNRHIDEEELALWEMWQDDELEKERERVALPYHR